MRAWRFRRPPGRRGGHERGAVAVEAALVTPLVFVLLFGVLESGMLFKDWLAVSNSVRAGVRMASAEPRVATYATDAAANVAREATALDMRQVEQLWVYRAAADGTPVGDTGDFASCSDCAKFRWDQPSRSFVEIGTNTWPSTEHNACPGDAGRMSVGVHLKMRHPSITGLMFTSMTISDHAVMSLEPIPGTASGGCK
jgi:Flp pilus assembly protein TadG